MALCVCVIGIYFINEGVRKDFVTDVIITTVTNLDSYHISSKVNRRVSI